MNESLSTSTGPAPQHTGQRSGQRSGASTTGTTDGHHPSLVDKAREQSSDMAADVRERAMDQGESQTKKAADTLREWAKDLNKMADSARSDAPARKLVKQAADRSYHAADLLEDRGFSGLTEGLGSFARTRPTLFLGSAALAGLLVGRLAKAGVKGGTGSSNGSGEHRQEASESSASSDYSDYRE